MIISMHLSINTIFISFRTPTYIFLQESGHYAVTEDRTVGFKQYCDNVKLSNDCIVIKSMNDLRGCSNIVLMLFIRLQ